MFDYQFLLADKMTSQGVETWQMYKSDGASWKIISVVWSAHPGA